MQRAVALAVREKGLSKRVACHTSGMCATRVLANGYDSRTVQELLGHSDFRTTMIYAHVLNRGGKRVRSAADGLATGFAGDKAETAYYSTKFLIRSQVPDVINFGVESS